VNTLDAPLAARLLPRMLEHCGDRGVLVITHDTEALPSFDRILDLADGRPGARPQRRDVIHFDHLQGARP